MTKFGATGKISLCIPSTCDDKEIMARTDTSHVVLTSGFSAAACGGDDLKCVIV